MAFVDLSPVGDPAVLATAVARALGLTPRSADAAEAHLAEALRHRELLLVLDNLEQLLDEARLLSRLLAAAPALRLLATSRIPLRLYGEHTLRVPPLHLPADDSTAAARDSEAVQLFVTRAQAVRPDFAPGAAELAAAGAICTALDGLPLAIELAAARIRLYSPQALLPLLRSRLALLTGGPLDLPRRQQTLRATLDWSHALLPADLRHLFARLGVFPGPLDAAAAADVSGGQDPAQTLDRLAMLADQGLLEVAAGDTPCFRMLQTVREYSLARLAETGEEDDARRRHLAHFLTRAVTARADLGGPRQAALLNLLEKAYPNLRGAMEYASQRAEQDGTCLDQGLRLATAIGLMWQRRGSLAEGILQLEKLLALDAAQGYASSPRSGRTPCWRPAHSPASRATMPGLPNSPGIAWRFASRSATTRAWPGRTASSARRRSRWVMTTRPTRTSGRNWPRRRWPATSAARRPRTTCSARPPGTGATSAARTPCSGGRCGCSARPTTPTG